LIWRIWQEKGTPLDELRYKWTYEDLLHANAILDMSSDMNTAMEGLFEFERKHNSGGQSRK
jgi:hypothetical protein